MRFIQFVPISFFRWCEQKGLGHLIQSGRWEFAIIETIHIMALAVLLGTIIATDLRLLGLGMRGQSSTELVRQFAPWTWGSFLIMVASGICLFLSEAVRLSRSGPFFYKMLLVILAVVIQLTINRKAAASSLDNRRLYKFAGSLSLICWLSIALAGRLIAFLP
jgi:hypothetical protein